MLYIITLTNLSIHEKDLLLIYCCLATPLLRSIEFTAYLMKRRLLRKTISFNIRVLLTYSHIVPGHTGEGTCYYPNNQ